MDQTLLVNLMNLDSFANQWISFICECSLFCSMIASGRYTDKPGQRANQQSHMSSQASEAWRILSSGGNPRQAQGMQDILWEFAIVSDWTLKVPRLNIVVRNTEHLADCESAERELVQPEICHLSTPQSAQVTYALHISEVGSLTTAQMYIEPIISLQYCNSRKQSKPWS